MDAQGLPIVSPKIDYGEVEKISPQRLLCFVNHFQAHTTAFLNTFATSCERRLSEVNWRIQRTEATLSVLEAKLSSVPGLDLVALPVQAEAEAEADKAAETEYSDPQRGQTAIEHDVTQASAADIPPLSSAADAAAAADAVVDVIPARRHPAYAKYFRMLHIGVPLQAVANKCRAENPHLDVDVLKTPDRPLSTNLLGSGEGEEEEEEEEEEEGWSQ